MRPIGTADRDRFAAFVAGLSDRTRRQRFLGFERGLSRAELDHFTDIDHRAHEALVAIDPRDGAIVGVAQYAPNAGEHAGADFAFVVADERQGQVVGTALAPALLRRATESGVLRLTASTLAENHVARGVLRKLGFRTRRIGWNVVELERLAPLVQGPPYPGPASSSQATFT